MNVRTTTGEEFEFSDPVPAVAFRATKGAGNKPPGTDLYHHWEKKRGLYLIYYHEDRIQGPLLDYVGQSGGVGIRIYDHFKDGLMLRWLDDYSVSLVETPDKNETERKRIEDLLIEELKPLYSAKNWKPAAYFLSPIFRLFKLKARG